MSTIAKFVRQSSEDAATETDAFSGWIWIPEPVGISSENAFTKPGLLEQINTTADQSDYLWYSLRYGSFPKKDTLLFLDKVVKFNFSLTLSALEWKVTSLFLKTDLRQSFMWIH